MSSEEFEAYVKKGSPTASNPLLSTTSNTVVRQLAKSEGAIPAAFDWVASGCVPPVKHQRGCGSCVFFSSVASMEAANCIYNTNGNMTRFSEQQSVSCFAGGCEGVWPVDVMNYVRTNGICRAKEYPYTSG